MWLKSFNTGHNPQNSKWKWHVFPVVPKLIHSYTYTLNSLSWKISEAKMYVFGVWCCFWGFEYGMGVLYLAILIQGSEFTFSWELSETPKALKGRDNHFMRVLYIKRILSHQFLEFDGVGDTINLRRGSSGIAWCVWFHDLGWTIIRVMRAKCDKVSTSCSQSVVTSHCLHQTVGQVFILIFPFTK